MHYNKDSGYKEALELASSHYENFPVVSVLVPSGLRRYVAIIYWFARTADDIADENQKETAAREQELDAFEARFLNTIRGEFTSDLDAALYDAVNINKLTISYFTDLISAFRQDITKDRYADMSELKDYCRRSANPVGRLMLELFNIRRHDAASCSDDICTALQLVNFWQDVSVDAQKGRIYIPGDFLDRFGISVEGILNGDPPPGPFEICMKELCDYTDNLFCSGSRLIPMLKGRFRYEIILTVLGGRKILAKIEKINYTSFRKRVKLSFFDVIFLFFNSLLWKNSQLSR